jgi:hypothetical protein
MTVPYDPVPTTCSVMGSVSSQNGYRLAALGIEILRLVIVYAPPSASEDRLTAPQGLARPQVRSPQHAHPEVAERARLTVQATGSVIPNESTDCIWLRLSGTEPGTCRFAADPEAIESGPEPEATERRWEVGAIGHGPTGAQLTRRIGDQIRAWDRDRTGQPVITAYPTGTPIGELAGGQVMDKQFTRLTVTFRTPAVREGLQQVHIVLSG